MTMTSKSCGVLLETSPTGEERSESLRDVDASHLELANSLENSFVLPLWVILTQKLATGNVSPEVSAVVSKVLEELNVSGPILVLPDAGRSGDSAQEAILLGQEIDDQLAERLRELLVALPEKAETLLQLLEKVEICIPPPRAEVPAPAESVSSRLFSMIKSLFGRSSAETVAIENTAEKTVIEGSGISKSFTARSVTMLKNLFTRKSEEQTNAELVAEYLAAEELSRTRPTEEIATCQSRSGGRSVGKVKHLFKRKSHELPAEEANAESPVEKSATEASDVANSSTNRSLSVLKNFFRRKSEESSAEEMSSEKELTADESSNEEPAPAKSRTSESSRKSFFKRKPATVSSTTENSAPGDPSSEQLTAVDTRSSRSLTMVRHFFKRKSVSGELTVENTAVIKESAAEESADDDLVPEVVNDKPKTKSIGSIKVFKRKSGNKGSSEEKSVKKMTETKAKKSGVWDRLLSPFEIQNDAGMFVPTKEKREKKVKVRTKEKASRFWDRLFEPFDEKEEEKRVVAVAKEETRRMKRKMSKFSDRLFSPFDAQVEEDVGKVVNKEKDVRDLEMPATYADSEAVEETERPLISSNDEQIDIIATTSKDSDDETIPNTVVRETVSCPTSSVIDAVIQIINQGDGTDDTDVIQVQENVVPETAPQASEDYVVMTIGYLSALADNNEDIDVIIGDIDVMIEETDVCLETSCMSEEEEERRDTDFFSIKDSSSDLIRT